MRPSMTFDDIREAGALLFGGWLDRGNQEILPV